jgi:hypothetical protein
MSELNDYSFERVTNAHYPLLQLLFADAFHQKISIEEITRRFDTRSLGAGLVGFIAIQNVTRKPAAYYGVFPVHITFNGRTILAAQSGDTMTHHEHRRKGLFIQLATLTAEICKEEGINLLFGSPNQSSYKGFVHHLQWEHKEDIVRYDLKSAFKAMPLPKLFQVDKQPHSLYFKYARFVLKKWIVPSPDTFHHTAINNYAAVFRNKAYINYKMSTNKFFIRIDEVVFWIRLSDVIWIGDVSDYTKVTASILQQLQRLAFWLGYNTIVLHLNESLTLPAVFNRFKRHDTDAACYKILTPVDGFERMIWTGADFDTW